ncbi:succinyl-diaminopimelate desuccinylase [Alteromonas facilis]|uniref:succinyl-diaminopimelate desuccinylase n=1 Tax=Alteromonas facilis TaxID=2048004 RepID=UPI000C28A382|nr:succinyl-diaminopimelate desuccinylase [Alteromonas facilis]
MPTLLSASARTNLAIDIAKSLIQCPSITPNDAGCQRIIQSLLEPLGFHCETINVNGVSNLIARIGNGERHIAFNGHTDVVPPGPMDLWQCDPFAANIIGDSLYGRGVADMKTGVAAMLAACQQFDWHCLDPSTSFWFLITSDEEGEAEDGSKAIKAYLDNQGVQFDSVLIGEPTASAHTGDTLKVGRRGSLSGTLLLNGKQGHVAYPSKAINAALLAAHVAHELSELPFACGSEDFPGTSLQITQIDTGAFSDNIIPGRCTINFNVRYASDFTEGELQTLIMTAVERVTSHYSITWQRPCTAYLSQPRNSERCLIRLAEQAIVDTTGRYPKLSTAGGTSDGRFFASEGTQVVELGVPNTTIHQVNERVPLVEIKRLQRVYSRLLSSWLG